MHFFLIPSFVTVDLVLCRCFGAWKGGIISGMYVCVCNTSHRECLDQPQI